MKKLLSIMLIVLGISFIGCASPKGKGENILFTQDVVHFVGVVSGANCETQYQLDLFENKTYFIRTTCLKNGVTSKNNDDIGRWKRDEDNRIVLRGGREAPLYFYISSPQTLEVMDMKGIRIDSELNYTLKLSSTTKTLEPRLFMLGMFSYMADAASFRENITGVQYPVIMEEDYISLEREYLRVRTVGGENLLTHIDGKIMLRDAMEGDKKVLSIVVKRFIKINKKTQTSMLKPNASFENTYWKLMTLDSKIIESSHKREAHIIFKDSKFKGHTGCNRMMGGAYTQNEEYLSLSEKGIMMTRMMCKGSSERGFLHALRSMRSYIIKGEQLTIFDGNQIELATFESVYLQ